MASDITRIDGSVDFSRGVNSLAVTTLKSERIPNGLDRSELAWAINAVMRDGGISQRPGWQPQGTITESGKLYQGGYIYNPRGADDPYLVISLSGEIWRVPLNNPAAAVSLSDAFSLYNNATQPIAFFEQAEEFLVIQSGDGVTNPLIWDGVTLRRSVGFMDDVIIPATITFENVDDAANVGFVVPAGFGLAINVQNPSTGIFPFAFTLIDPLTIPAVGATVTVAATYSGSNNPPTQNFLIPAVPSAGIPQIGYLSITARTTSQTSFTTPEIPPATAMDYYMGRLWYAQNRTYSAGDIVGGSSGTLAYNFRDSVLKMTENPMVIGGDGFTVPEGNDNIRALEHNAVLDASMGQGRLMVFTRKAVYSLTVPVTRDDWIKADSNNQPLQSVVQLNNGAVGARSVVPVNGDLFYQSLEPGIRSLISAMRYFNQWGNVEISSKINRLLQFNDRALMENGSGIYFNNRLLMAMLPEQTDSGVIHKAIAPIDFQPISTVATDSDRSPIWEGVYEGLDVLQLFVAEQGGVERAYAVALGEDGSFKLWELTTNDRLENGTNRVVWQMEFPAFTFNSEVELKKLVGGELWIDRLYGTVLFQMDYRPDGETCWTPWHTWQDCSPQNTCENARNPVCYPPTEQGPSYRSTFSLPVPPVNCSQMGRPSDVGYQFQARLTVKGYCRIRGVILHAVAVDRKLYANIPCT